MLQIIFWILIGLILYAYIGYTILLLIISAFKKKITPPKITDDELPEVTLLIAAYNERNIIDQKVLNSQSLNYPKNKLKHLWVTDGSDDGSAEYLKKTKKIKVIHQNKRAGKTAALNRAMQFIDTPFIVFTDANTVLEKDTIINLVRWFKYKKIGCVAGEKKIITSGKDKAVSAGEGIYWNYESFIKKLEAHTGSTMGAAGELYAIRTGLFKAPDNKIVLDDFMVSMHIAEKGYKVYYDPEAAASENSSLNISEEIKRKVRIAAGSFQVLFSQGSFLNFISHFFLSFQYFSHKVLRWFVVPFALIAILFINAVLSFKAQNNILYNTVLLIQVIFYILAIFGGILQKKDMKNKFLFIPFYLTIMNYSLIRGFFRYLKGAQNAAWEKAKRL